MYHPRLLIAGVVLLSTFLAKGQLSICPCDSVRFELQDDYYGEKTWEFSTDGVSWQQVSLDEDTAFTPTQAQLGWYRASFHDADCDSTYVSDAVRLVRHDIDVGGPLTTSILGRVLDESGHAVEGALVKAGCGMGVSGSTDRFGVFLLVDVPVFEDFAFLTVEKSGYFTGSRSFMPGAGAEGGICNAEVTLLTKDLAATLSAAQGGQVTYENILLTFPAGGFVIHGAPYNGDVLVFINGIDPAQDTLGSTMPGMLLGVLDGQSGHLRSYGMSAIALQSPEGLSVQLGEGSSATLEFMLASTELASAPASIPLWYFDETLGYWAQEGDATLVGDHYIGQVSHFSWWNVDVFVPFTILYGTVLDDTAGSPLPNARVRVSAGAMGYQTVHTNSAGTFAMPVPLGYPLTVSVALPCGPGAAWNTLFVQSIGPIGLPLNVTLVVPVPYDHIMGHVVACDGAQPTQAYVLANGVANACIDGAYTVYTCLSQIGLRGVDATTGYASELLQVELVDDTTMVPDLLTCLPLFGEVADVEGNIYQTVLIGQQEWMAENLRTHTYRNGDPIPEVLDNLAWTQVSSDACCALQNNPVYEADFGLLYNWYAVDDQRGVCPTGWHVPTNLEYSALAGTLGGQDVAGGKLKAVSPLWTSSNTNATNVTGFSALPGGARNDANGTPMDPGYYCFLWTSTYYPALDRAASVLMTSPFPTLYVDFDDGVSRGNGFAVRCKRD